MKDRAEDKKNKRDYIELLLVIVLSVCQLPILQFIWEGKILRIPIIMARTMLRLLIQRRWKNEFEKSINGY